jgi:hypothetical protein
VFHNYIYNQVTYSVFIKVIVLSLGRGIGLKGRG